MAVLTLLGFSGGRGFDTVLGKPYVIS